ncbi:hypothetical protein [Nocardia ignorata]|uniref:Uncharacterized protein n=1 Tax=Nocardia ignorata TaxID=145285 RepID=A0A4R6NYI3_NOCIG|nr:hypothetical protein [Nocardia ignorata]TDP29836.1 hypothetical protein DFR75_112104 [Nocardia ignorata]
MKRIRIETGSDVRRWDTYELDVPDDFDVDSEDAEQYLHDRLGADEGVELIDTSYESDGDKYPPDDQDINSWDEV